MDLLFLCRDAREDAVIGNVAMAMRANAGGKMCGVLFTGEALAALAGEAFRWSPLFEGRPARITITRRATAAGFPIAAERDARWTDILRLLDAARGAGVRLMACPMWTEILDLAERLPPPLDRPSESDVLDELSSAKVIGGY